eukprot:TRINITY_DN2521_c0_g1_i3.p3 TRINITY_DN2521_c0_g1~~TRINITY_DN2521_c0_g1_i3.p3  ORF type:complete len:120 (+),score=31.42 TRINITY_DN2521_c0_g1_i3:2186-2545(+)
MMPFLSLHLPKILYIVHLPHAIHPLDTPILDIEEGAPCQVNIEDQTRSSINNNISSSVTSELFSVAEREVFSLMKFHSFPLFLRHRRSSIGDGSSSFNSAAAVLIVTGSDYDETEIELA